MRKTSKNEGDTCKVDPKHSSTMSTPDVIEIPNEFHFWNGDEYTGQFLAVKDKQKIVMDGRGVYKTADGQTYEGIWENDSLKEVIKMVFKDKSTFSGSLDEMMIQGPGTYTFKEDVEIEGEFVDNNLIGSVTLIDPNKHVWKGEVKEKDTHVNFYPLHPFWQSVLSLPSCDQLVYGEAEEHENFSDEFNYW